MKRLWIFYHRRRAVNHRAKAEAWTGIPDWPWSKNNRWHVVYAAWHLEQIFRLEFEAKLREQAR